jgi:hypothetical protein
MKTTIKIMMTFAVILLFGAGCSKYQDGPKFSLLTKKARLCGHWKIDNVTSKGNDVTEQVKTSLGDNYELDIEKDGKYKTKGNFPEEGTWELGEDKDDVYLKSTTNPGPELGCRILRLKSKELWLKVTYPNGDQTITHYIPA